MIFKIQNVFKMTTVAKAKTDMPATLWESKYRSGLVAVFKLHVSMFCMLNYVICRDHAYSSMSLLAVVPFRSIFMGGALKGFGFQIQSVQFFHLRSSNVMPSLG
jgi:hypothetical protein